MAYPETLSELTNYPKALSHAGAGGGANLKTLNIVNNTAKNISFVGCIVDGYFSAKEVNAGETAALQYVTPSADGGEDAVAYPLTIESQIGNNITVSTPDGVTYRSAFPPAGLYILNEAADGATVTFKTTGAE